MAASMEKHYRRVHVYAYSAKWFCLTYFVNGMHIAYITADSRILHENKAMTVEEFSKFNYSKYCAEITVKGDELKHYLKIFIETILKLFILTSPHKISPNFSNLTAPKTFLYYESYIHRGCG